MGERKVSVERVIPTEPQRIFDLLADPAMHPVLDGSGTVRRALEDNPERLSMGAKFGMDMRLVGPYRIRNTVVEFEEGRRIAWRHFGRQVWRYELLPDPAGTKVIETFDYAPALSPRVLELLGFPERNRKGMEATLQRIEQHLAGRG